RFNTLTRQPWGLAADQRPSTHPVAGNGAEDAAAALLDFDGISYAKGSSVLRQLNARLGDEVFLGGARLHLERHRFGNATMADLVDSWHDAGAHDVDGFLEGWLRCAGVDELSADRSGQAIRVSPPADNHAHRTHDVRVALGGAVPGTWQVESVVVPPLGCSLELPTDRPVVIDPDVRTWAVTLIDDVTLAQLPTALRATADRDLRAGIWSSLRATFDSGQVPAEVLVELLVGCIPTEDDELALQAPVAWLSAEAVLAAADPRAAKAALHAAYRQRLDTATPGSPLQFTALRAAVRTSQDPAWLRPLAEATAHPDGVVVDADLAWLARVRLSAEGGCEVAELDRWLAADPTAKALVAHTRARSAAPTVAAKEFAWDRFTGRVNVANYEIEGAGEAMWTPGQESIWGPFVERYFTDVQGTDQVRHGWMLAEAATAFFPDIALDEGVVALAEATASRPDLDHSLVRVLRDEASDLARRIRRRAAGGPAEPR
ncbi:MAG: ERAP1-like C-terminal domain-containing protein, partial [Nocardioides sp.]